MNQASAIPWIANSVEPAPQAQTHPAQSALNIHALTAAIVRGDEAAFETFYAEYSPRVFKLLVVVTNGDVSLAQELHQRVMIKAAQKLKVLDTEELLWAWLARVARNAWLDLLRRRVHEKSFLQNAAQSPLSLPLPSERTQELEAALASLPPHEKRLIENFYFDHLPQSEIARSKMSTVKAVQSELWRVRKKLRAIMERALKR